MRRFGLYSRRVVCDKEVREATITIEDGKITYVEFGLVGDTGKNIEDLGNAVIMPGLIDSHVHINEPGRTDWEGFDTATRAAAAGGITTLIDMPLNSSPVTTNATALDTKLDAARKSIHVNCGFYGGLVPGSARNVVGLIEGGVFGIKAFLTHSGIDEFPNVDQRQLEEVLPTLKKYNTPLLVHAELDSPHKDQKALDQNPTSYLAFLKSRPKSWEDNAIRMMIGLCKQFRSRIHIVHLSSSNSIQPLQDAIDSGLPISTETCPHYLFFNAEGIGDGETLLKCAPPIREKQNNELLWGALKNGTISFVVTDHSPAPPSLKEIESGDFKKAWGGIAGLQYSLPVVWTEACKRGFTLSDLSELMSTRVAEFLGISNHKGKIAKGYDADLIVWHPEKEFTVTTGNIHHKHKITPYLDQRLKGVVERTYVLGECVFNHGKFESLNKGRILTRTNYG